MPREEILAMFFRERAGFVLWDVRLCYRGLEAK